MPFQVRSMYHEVTQKSKRKTLALGTSIADVFNKFEIWILPPLSHSLRRDHVTTVSAEFCTPQFDKKLSRSRRLLSSFLAISQLFPPARAGQLRLTSVFWKMIWNEHQMKYKKISFVPNLPGLARLFINLINRELCCEKSSSTLGSVMKTRTEGKEVIVKDIVN